MDVGNHEPWDEVLTSPERRLVYADWLIERGDPRGALLVGARLLTEASTARARATARLEIVAALKRVASWLDERLPVGKAWRSSDVRGVRSDAVGFLTHQDGVLHRLRVPGPGAFVPPALFEVVPTISQLAVAHDAGNATPVEALLGAPELARVRCLELELPAFLSPFTRVETLERFPALTHRRDRPLEVRLSEGVVDERTIAEGLQRWAGASMMWLDRARVESSAEALSSARGVVPHLRLTETNLELRVARELASSGSLASLVRLELKDWPIGAPSLEQLLKGATALQHLAIIRSPLGAELPRLLIDSGRLLGLESLDVSGCLLGRAGARLLLERVGPATRRLSLRFNQLVEYDFTHLAKLATWPRGCEVKFEETTFGPNAHQALSELARAHQLTIEVNGCAWTLKS